MNRPPVHSKSLIVRAGAAVTRVNATDNRLVMDCGMPWLAGPVSQELAWGESLVCSAGEWQVQAAEGLAGVLISGGGTTLEDESWQLYRRLFAITRGLNRYRIWNYVPQINRLVAGVENYVAFNAGRHRAFSGEFGEIALSDLSAASAVGTRGGSLALAFVAGPDPVRIFENPLQTPVVDYPECYGLKSPLFVRGSMVSKADSSTCWHLSGTASIRASETIGGDIARQLDVTLENIVRLLGAMAVPAVRRADWKVFLRDRRDLEVCRRRLADVFPGEVERMMFVEADICRRDLLLEIEGGFQVGQ